MDVLKQLHSNTTPNTTPPNSQQGSRRGRTPKTGAQKELIANSGPSWLQAVLPRIVLTLRMHAAAVTLPVVFC